MPDRLWHSPIRAGDTHLFGRAQLKDAVSHALEVSNFAAEKNSDRPTPVGRTPLPPPATHRSGDSYQTGVAGLPTLRADQVLTLQRLAGNRAVGALLGNLAAAGNPLTGPSGTTDGPAQAGVPDEAFTVEPVELDMDGDEEVELHTLRIDPETDALLLESDSQTLEGFLNKYKPRLTSPQDQQLLTQIEADAQQVYIGRYGSKYQNTAGYQKRKAPTAQQRGVVKGLLKRIAANLQLLLKPKLRPRSHKEQHNIKTIGSDIFCEKVVMQPLSLLPRDDKVTGGPPHEETQLWRDLTNIAGYKRGHILNEHVHGPGTNDNLVPISTAFNSRMREGVEKVTKESVNSQNKVVRFEAEALDWGQFPGAFGFPDEKALPNRFHFRVTKMQKGLPGTGAQQTDWQDTTTVLFDAVENHDIPVDVVKTVVAPTVMTFTPGLYYYPYGSIKPAPPHYLLRGSFNINNLGDPKVLAGLGIDDATKLQYARIDATVLTEYQLPPGYGIKTLPPTEIEYVHFGKLFTFKSPDRAFVVYNRADEGRLKQEHQTKVDDFKEEQRLLAQANLDRQQQEKLKKIQLENATKLQAEERRARESEAKRLKDQNDQFRHSLLAQIRTEAAKYIQEYGEPFRQIRERILYDANNEWKLATNLTSTDMDTLLAPVRARLDKAAEQFKEAEERITTLTERFDTAVRQQYLPGLISPNAIASFKQAAGKSFETYDDYWRDMDPIHLATGDLEKFWQSADKKLRTFYEKAKRLDLKREHEDADIIDPESYNVPKKRRVEAPLPKDPSAEMNIEVDVPEAIQ